MYDRLPLERLMLGANRYSLASTSKYQLNPPAANESLRDIRSDPSLVDSLYKYRMHVAILIDGVPLP